MENKDFYKIISNQPTSQQILFQCFELWKNQNPNHTLGKFCKISSIPSKGYLSELLNGKRKLTAKHSEKIGRSLGLKTISLHYFMTLVELENSRITKDIDELKQVLNNLKKSLEINVIPTPFGETNTLFIFQVFCAFGLFQCKPSRENLIHYFGKENFVEVDNALNELLKSDIIDKEHDTFVIKNENLILTTALQSPKKIIEESLKQTIKQIDKIDDKLNSHFETIVISVQKKKYQKNLVELKEQISVWQSKFEDADAESLISFNIQVYEI